MARYLVETSHTARECMWAMEQALRGDTAFLDHFEWGCKDGEHRGWAMVDAENKFAAQLLVPRVMHPYTRIVELTQFSPAEARAYHEILLPVHAAPYARLGS
jgi:hypothetical protein